MGLLGRLRRAIGGSSARGDEEDGEYRCISCGTYLDRNYHSCPECGGQFVAPTESAEK